MKIYPDSFQVGLRFLNIETVFWETIEETNEVCKLYAPDGRITEFDEETFEGHKWPRERGQR